MPLVKHDYPVLEYDTASKAVFQPGNGKKCCLLYTSIHAHSYLIFESDFVYYGFEFFKAAADFTAFSCHGLKEHRGGLVRL